MARASRAAAFRGALVTGFLTSTKPAGAYVSGLDKDEYSGFNLLAYDGTELWWLSNRDGARALEPGIYGLGNLLLDSPEVEPANALSRSDLACSRGRVCSGRSPRRASSIRCTARCSTV